VSLLTRIGRDVTPAEPSPAEVAARRVQQARDRTSWREVPDGYLVRRGRFHVDPETDEVYTLHGGALFSSAGIVEFDLMRTDLVFEVRAGDVVVFERRPGTWSERYARQLGAVR